MRCITGSQKILEQICSRMYFIVLPPHIYILNTIMTDLEDFEFFCTEKADQMASFLLDTLS